ncbi:hypothetical protein C8R47DRAFT_430405 [Mycena vitilis]|nr:hypothetical protein C8R47DRAFT_430405 [Mycena vitilis]
MQCSAGVIVFVSALLARGHCSAVVPMGAAERTGDLWVRCQVRGLSTQRSLWGAIGGTTNEGAVPDEETCTEPDERRGRGRSVESWGTRAAYAIWVGMR